MKVVNKIATDGSTPPTSTKIKSMTKYRIQIETRRNGNISYQVQYHTISSWSDGRYFDSIQEAEQYLDEIHSNEIINTEYVDYEPKS